MPAPSPVLDRFDAQLAHEYERMQQLLAGQPTAAVQRRFAEYAVFPKLGWPLLGDGAADAVARQDPVLLGRVLTRFVKCAHATWGHPGADGIHFSGYDHYSLVVTAVHSAPLGTTHLRSVFHADRKPSTNGFAPYKHAANLLSSLAHPAWPHRAKVLKPAEAFVHGKAGAAVDKAFVAVFLGLVAGDAAATGQALVAFNAGYAKSDWGRHKPLTRVPFLQGLVALADAWSVAPVAAEVRAALFTPAEAQLWRAFDALRADGSIADDPFATPLDFLNAVPLFEPPTA